MTDFGFKETAEQSATTQELDYDYQLSDNVIDDLVDYSRSCIVRNEQQFVLTALGYISGFFESPKHFNSGVLIGTAGSGKSHLQNKIEKIFPDEYMYEATSGSEKSIIYDDSWEDCYVASLDELQKPSAEIIEILKSLHGGEDEEFRYQVTGDGRGADRDVDEIVRSAKPYWFLYAQMEPDFEMWDRLIKVPVHESKQKNEGVLRTQWDHQFINFGDDDSEYMYDFEEGRKALKDHMRNIPKESWVKIPAGEDEFGWDAVEHARHIFDIARSETNRVSGMVANLVRASALLNYKNREKMTVRMQDGVKEAYIAEPQDLANVLACREVLLATTHQLDRKRKAICVAIEQAGGTQKAAEIHRIQDYLRKTDESFVKRSQIEAMLGDLQDNYLVEKLERAGENGRHKYQFLGWHSLGKFEINDDFKDVFSTSHDPFTGDEFIDTARNINDDLTPKASDFMGEDDVTVESDSKQQQRTLTDDSSDDVVEVDLAPHEEAVRAALKENLDGERVENLDEREPSIKQLVGVVPMGPDAVEDEHSVDGTLFDPEHEVWQSGPDGWVESPQDAEKEVDKAMRRLAKDGVFRTSTTKSRAGEPLVMEVTVKDV
jgi:hypothetical protein